MGGTVPNASLDIVTEDDDFPVADNPSRGSVKKHKIPDASGMTAPVSTAQFITLPLPVELILEVACHLSGDWAFGTLANLNVTSRALHERTLPILYETIVWDDRRKDLYGFLCLTRDGQDYGSYLKVPKGYMYTRVAVIHIAEQAEMACRDEARSLGGDDQGTEKKTADVLWPRKIATIIKRPQSQIMRTKVEETSEELAYTETTCHVQLVGQISSEWLNDILCNLRLRWETAEGYIFPTFKPIGHVLFFSLMSERASIFKAPTYKRQPDQFWVKGSRDSMLFFRLHPDMQADATSGETLEEVLAMVNRPRGKSNFKRADLVIEHCNFEMFSLLLPLLQRLLVSQPYSGMGIDVRLSESNSDLVEAAFIKAIETWKHLWADILQNRQGGEVASSELYFSVGGATGEETWAIGKIKPQIGRDGTKFLAQFRKSGRMVWEHAIIDSESGLR